MNPLLFQPRAVGWGLFFGLILVAWSLLFFMSADLPDPNLAKIYGVDFWISLCQVNGLSAGYPVMLTMWILMVGAMMMPTIAPTLNTYNDLMHTKAAGLPGLSLLALGYLIVWGVFSTAAAGAQFILLKQGLVSPTGSSLSLGLNAALLLLAGTYQFSRVKEACLNQCRAPLMFFMGNWRDGHLGALEMGLRLGLVCLGCCWALMLLGFVGGTMNMLWMGLATLIMVAEKLPQAGRFITAPLGFLLIFAGLITGVFAIL